MVDEGTLKDIPDFPQRPLTWASLAGVDRVIEHVAKSVLYCYVIKPRSVSAEHMTSPKCIPEFSVKVSVINKVKQPIVNPFIVDDVTLETLCR
jgi:tRNA-splicing endonuclease subunit Sen2